MVRLTVLYGKPDDPDAFVNYYEGTHVPLANKIPKCDRYIWGKVLGTPTGDEPPYFLTAELWFADMDTFGAAMGSPEGQAAADDVANFATGGVTMLIAEGR
jgi:uncharacterized protein (TIGR02118 family)